MRQASSGAHMPSGLTRAVTCTSRRCWRDSESRSSPGASKERRMTSTSSEPRTGHRHVAEMMRGYGISHVFFVPTILTPALAAMGELGITRVTTHGEKAAAYMADGYARASHKI